MPLTRAEVDHVAKLARLALTEGERVAFTLQLGRILTHMQVLNRLDTDDVPPTFHVLPIENVVRPDAVNASLAREQALQNAPQAEAGFFKVPKVIE